MKIGIILLALTCSLTQVSSLPLNYGAALARRHFDTADDAILSRSFGGAAYDLQRRGGPGQDTTKEGESSSSGTVPSASTAEASTSGETEHGSSINPRVILPLPKRSSTSRRKLTLDIPASGFSGQHITGGGVMGSPVEMEVDHGLHGTKRQASIPPPKAPTNAKTSHVDSIDSHDLSEAAGTSLTLGKEKSPSPEPANKRARTGKGPTTEPRRSQRNVKKARPL